MMVKRQQTACPSKATLELYLLLEISFCTGILATLLKGDSSCPCINPWPTTGVLTNRTFIETATGQGCLKVKAKPEAAQCYPLDFGVLECREWSKNLGPYCADSSGTPFANAPKSCKARWCYVDGAACSLSPSLSQEFGDLGFHYSYETCGAVDSFHSELLLKSLQGRALKVGIPSNDAYPAIQKKGGGPWEGWAWDVFQMFVKEAGVSFEIVPISNESLAKDKDPYNACSIDTGLKKVDICIGDFWDVAKRRQYALISPMISVGKFVLTVFIQSDENFINKLSKVFEPFSPALWLLVIALCLFTGTSLWLFGDAGGGNIVRGTIRGFRTAIVSFLGQEKPKPKSAEGKMIIFGFAFLCMLGASSYTANLASFLLVSNMKQPIKSVADAVKLEAKICMNFNLNSMFVAQYPMAAELPVGLSSTKYVVPSMDEGKCQAGLLTYDKYYVYMRGQEGRFEGQNHCNKLKIPDEAVLSVSVGFPVASDIADAFGFWVTSRREDGRLFSVFNAYPAPKDKCPTMGGLGASKMVPSDLGGVFMIVLAFALGAYFLYFVGRLPLPRLRKKRMNEANGSGNDATCVGAATTEDEVPEDTVSEVGEAENVRADTEASEHAQTRALILKLSEALEARVQQLETMQTSRNCLEV